jgi:hypothetical protein
MKEELIFLTVDVVYPNGSFAIILEYLETFVYFHFLYVQKVPVDPVMPFNCDSHSE